MSAAGPRAALALKTQSALMSGDMGIAPTVAGGQAQRAAGAAQATATGSAGGSKPTQYLNGHNRKRAQVVCEWFDGKYKEGSAERAAKVAEAGRVRGNALKLFAKRKKKMKSTS